MHHIDNLFHSNKAIFNHQFLKKKLYVCLSLSLSWSDGIFTMKDEATGQL